VGHNLESKDLRITLFGLVKDDQEVSGILVDELWETIERG